MCSLAINEFMVYFSGLQVLMFPFLLDDHLLAGEFEIFIEAADDYHKLKLDEHQQYPVKTLFHYSLVI